MVNVEIEKGNWDTKVYIKNLEENESETNLDMVARYLKRKYNMPYNLKVKEINCKIEMDENGNIEDKPECIVFDNHGLFYKLDGYEEEEDSLIERILPENKAKNLIMQELMEKI